MDKEKLVGRILGLFDDSSEVSEAEVREALGMEPSEADLPSELAGKIASAKSVEECLLLPLEVGSDTLAEYRVINRAIALAKTVQECINIFHSVSSTAGEHLALTKAIFLARTKEDFRLILNCASAFSHESITAFRRIAALMEAEEKAEPAATA